MSDDEEIRVREDEGESAAEKAEHKAEAREEAAQRVKELEEDPPKNLEDWPEDDAKYMTFGGREGEEGYDESVTAKLGPSEVRHHEDGSVSVGGEKVDNPEEYKGDPIPGGPTDPNAPKGPERSRERVKGHSTRGEDDEEERGGDGDPGPGSQDGQTGESGGGG